MSSAILDNVIREEQAPGTFRGRREKSIFIPHSYKDRQLSLISSLLEAGGYIGKKERVCASMMVLRKGILTHRLHV